MMNWTELVVYMQGWWTHLKVSDNRKKNVSWGLLWVIFEKIVLMFFKSLIESSNFQILVGTFPHYPLAVPPDQKV